MRCEQCHNQICMYRRTAGECVFDGQTSEIHITPNSGFFPFEKDCQPADAMKALDEKIKKVSERGTWDGVDVDKYLAEIRGADTELRDAALALVDAVERYVAPQKGQFCRRAELLIAKDNLKTLIK